VGRHYDKYSCAKMADPAAQHLIQKVIDKLEEFNDKIIEAAKDVLRYVELYPAAIDFYVTVDGNDLQRFQAARAEYRDGREHCTNATQLAAFDHKFLIDTRSTFDEIITFIIKCLSRCVKGNEVRWKDWYMQTKAIGDSTLERVVPVTKYFFDIDTLADKFAAMDRILVAMHGCPSMFFSSRSPFVLEFQDNV